MIDNDVKTSLVADLVAHMAVIGQAYQGLRVDIRNWLPVRPPPLLSSFPACCSSGPLSHAVSQRARYAAAGRLSQPPAAAPAPGSQSRKDAAGLSCCLCRVFSRDMLLCVKLLSMRGLKLQADTFHPV